MATIRVDSERHFANDFEENDVKQFLNSEHTDFSQAFKQEILGHLSNMLESLLNQRHQEKSHDHSVYTGTAGQAMALLQTKQLGGDLDEEGLCEKCVEKAKDLLSKTEGDTEFAAKGKSRISFFGGVTGPDVLAARLCLEQGRLKEAVRHISQVLRWEDEAVHNNKMPDEVLFGRAGYVNGLLLLLQDLEKHPIDGSTKEQSKRIESTIRNVASKIVDSGQQYGRLASIPGCPLWWQWHDKEYLGSAHGVAGILQVLIRARKYLPSECMSKQVIPTLHYLASLQFPSGNFPSSMGRSQGTDKLVHWCHGAPGIVHLLLDAHHILGDESYLEKAKRCGSVIWERGLLKKGYSMCHGVSGNAYAFLHLWQATSDPKYLHQAGVFISWCFKYGQRNPNPPDRPLSLFEGISGPIYLMSDVLCPNLMHANFPGFSNI